MLLPSLSLLIRGAEGLGGARRLPEAFNHASHERLILIEEAKLGKYHVVDVDAFQRGVSKYLDSKFRTQVADRLILVALFDCEITAYLRHVFEVDIFTKRSIASSHRKPFTAWLIGRAWGIVFQAITIAAIIGLRYLDWISQDTCVVLILLSIAFFLLGTVISIPMYFAYKNHGRVRSQLWSTSPKTWSSSIARPTIAAL